MKLTTKIPIINIGKNTTVCYEKVRILYNGKPLLPFQVDELVNRLTKEDVLKLETFSSMLWHKISTSKYYRSADCTRMYWNPLRKILFIGYERIKFRSKYFAKDIPKSILPSGWRVIIRNIWDDKYNYDYFSHEPIEFEKHEDLENVIVSKLEYCLHNDIDFMEICKVVDERMRNLL